MKSKKILLTTILTITLIVVSGCVKNKQSDIENENTVVVEEDNEQEEITPEPKQEENNATSADEVEVVESDIDTSDWKVCINNDLGFELKYPDNWKECKYNNNKFFIKTNNDLDNKYIILWIEENDLSDSQYIIDNLNKNNYPVYTSNQIKIFKLLGYAQSLDGIGMFINDNFYWVNFSVEDEINNSNVNGRNFAGWSEDRIEYIWNIAKTIKKIK